MFRRSVTGVERGGGGVLASVCPAAAEAVEAFDDLAPAWLFDEERAVTAAAVPRRQQEFATARHCARSALARLGAAPAPLLPGPLGAPLWPDGVVGSITHCEGYRAAAVARRRDLLSIGVDAEPDEALPAEVATVVATPDELARLPQTGGPAWDRLLFCAKEAVYKAWSPLTARFLEFHDVAVTISADGHLTAELLVEPATVAGRRLDRFSGRWTRGHGLLVAVVTVPATVTP